MFKYNFSISVHPVMADMGESNNIKVTSNDTLVLQCNVTGGYPHPNIAWYKGSTPITKDKWTQIIFQDYNRTLVSLISYRLSMQNLENYFYVGEEIGLCPIKK